MDAQPTPDAPKPAPVPITEMLIDPAKETIRLQSVPKKDPDFQDDDGSGSGSDSDEDYDSDEERLEQQLEEIKQNLRATVPGLSCLSLLLFDFSPLSSHLAFCWHRNLQHRGACGLLLDCQRCFAHFRVCTIAWLPHGFL